ncbi:MAG: hypothetical protein VX113_05705 [Pseudomonadota bacterium]|nr:hypothetical protein [Pseudomonadota bacterium]
MNSLNPASHALTRPPSRPSAVRLSLACAFVALLGLAGCGGGGGGGAAAAADHFQEYHVSFRMM